MFILIAFLFATSPGLTSTEYSSLAECIENANAVPLDDDHRGSAACVSERSGIIYYSRYAK